MFTSVKVRRLCEQLASGDRDAAQSLGELGDLRAVEPLIKALGDIRGFSLRCAAAEALGKLGDRRAVEPLIKALGDRTGDIRQAAAVALGKLGDRRAIEPLLKALGDRTGDIRQAAACALAQLGDGKWEPLIEGDMFDFGRLAASGDPRAAEPLAVLLEGGGDVSFLMEYMSVKPHVQAVVSETLGKLSGPRAVTLLIEALGSKAVGRAAAEALGKLGDRRAVEPLLKALRDGDGNLRCDAAEALGKLGDPRAVEPLIKALGDNRKRAAETFPLRRVAADALGKLGDQRAIEPLFMTLGDSDGGFRCAAAQSLAQLGDGKWEPLIEGDMFDFGRLAASGDPRAVEPLIKALGNSYCAAAEALGKLGDRRAVEPLIKALGDGGGNVRPAAAEALGKLGDRRAVEPLIRALGSEFPSVGEAAAEALEKLGDRRAIDPLLKALGDGGGNVRPAAAVALGKFGDPRAVGHLIEVLGDICGRVSRRQAAAAGDALGKLGDPRAVEPLITALGNFRRCIRCAAAEALKGLLTSQSGPAIDRSRWKHLHELITQPHTDESDSCNAHTDTGIAGDFPPEPPTALSRKTDF